MSIGGDVLLTRADRQRHKIPIYNLTTGQPLPDVKGEGTPALNFDNSAFQSLFPKAELAIVRIPRPPTVPHLEKSPNTRPGCVNSSSKASRLTAN